MFVVSRDETLIENYAEELGMALSGNTHGLLFFNSTDSLIRIFLLKELRSNQNFS